jgi:hypothetical protein
MSAGARGAARGALCRTARAGRAGAARGGRTIKSNQCLHAKIKKV